MPLMDITPYIEKLNQLKSGKQVRPPKQWWDKIKDNVKSNPKYKMFSDERINMIVAGIWYNYPTIKQLSIIRSMIKPESKSKHDIERQELTKGNVV